MLLWLTIDTNFDYRFHNCMCQFDSNIPAGSATFQSGKTFLLLLLGVMDSRLIAEFSLLLCGTSGENDYS